MDDGEIVPLWMHDSMMSDNEHSDAETIVDISSDDPFSSDWDSNSEELDMELNFYTDALYY